MRSEYERAEPVSQSGFDESSDRDVDSVARVERVGTRCHLADDLFDREQCRVMLEQQVEDAAGGVAHSITGHRYSK